jgi:hypothetical protein
VALNQYDKECLSELYVCLKDEAGIKDARILELEAQVKELVGVLQTCSYALNGTGPQAQCKQCDGSVGFVCEKCCAGMDVLFVLKKYNYPTERHTKGGE